MDTGNILDLLSFKTELLLIMGIPFLFLIAFLLADEFSSVVRGKRIHR